MGRGKLTAAEDLFYGEMDTGSSSMMLAEDAIRAERWEKLWSLMKMDPELGNNGPLMEKIILRIVTPRAAEMFGEWGYSDFSMVCNFLQGEATDKMNAGTPPEHTFDFSDQDIVAQALKSGGPFGDAAREWVAARYLFELSPEVVVWSAHSWDNRQALVEPLSRGLVQGLLRCFPDSPSHSPSAGFCAEDQGIVHLRSSSEKTHSACGREDFGYASAPFGVWRDASARRDMTRCAECSARSDKSVVRIAEQEESLDGGEWLPWDKDEVAEAAHTAGLSALDQLLAEETQQTSQAKWERDQEFLAESMMQKIISDSF